MKKMYEIGRMRLLAELPEAMPVPENLKKFEDSFAEEEADCRYVVEYTDSLEKVEQRFCEAHPQAREIRRDALRIRTANGAECRILNFRGSEKPYGILLEESGQPDHVWVDPAVVPLLQYDTIFLSLFALEKRMLERGALILHSAYMCREGKAVLFSAPSETGKSTQAALWERYRGTRTVNGDRSLLIREKNGWFAHGWPVCGSSEICYNEVYPVQAIVMLHQAKENSIRPLRGAEAARKLIAQITINMWDARLQMQAMDQIDRLLTEVPVYELGCDISEEAVKCLEEVLKAMP